MEGDGGSVEYGFIHYKLELDVSLYGVMRSFEACDGVPVAAIRICGELL